MPTGHPFTKTILVRSSLPRITWAHLALPPAAYAQTLSLSLFGIIAGACAAYWRRARWMMFFGLVVRLVSVGAMIRTKGVQYVATVLRV